MHEDIPILNFLVPKEFKHEDGRLTGMTFEKVKAEYDAQRPPPAGADRRAGSVLRMRRRAGRGRPGERVPLDRARHRHRVRRVGHAGGRRSDHAVHQSAACSSAATRRSARRTSSGRWRTATRRRSPSTSSARARTCSDRPPPLVNLTSQKMGIHEWSYDNDISLDLRFKVPHRDKAIALQRHQGRGRTRLRRRAGLRGGAALPELRRADGVHRQAVHRVRRLRRHLPGRLHHLHRERRGGRAARRG